MRGPAPPSAVAAAAKIAFSSLGTATSDLFETEEHEKRPAEQPPVDKPGVALLERSVSGTMCVPAFHDSAEGDFSEWTLDKDTPIHESTAYPSSPSSVRSALEDPERRNRNLQWLRLHFRSLGDIGRLPFNNADLWQLHQYYFSPPYPTANETTNQDEEEEDVPVDDKNSKMIDGKVPPPSPAVETNNSPLVTRTVSFQTLGDAFAASDIVAQASNHKRRPDEENTEDSKPAAKRAKNLKSRIGYYPRIMVRRQFLQRKLSILGSIAPHNYQLSYI